VISFTPQTLYSHEKIPRYPFDKRLDGPQNRSGHRVEEKNSQPPPEIEYSSSDLVQASIFRHCKIKDMDADTVTDLILHPVNAVHAKAISCTVTFCAISTYSCMVATV
jgi:hypothetical protein